MRTRILVVSVLGLTLLTFAAAVCPAETTLIRVKVPFDFAIGEQGLPAGEYTLTFPMLQVGEQILLMNTDGRGLQLIQTHSFEQPKWDTKTYLVFHRYGDQYFLSRVWNGAYGTGRELARSSREKKLAETVKRTAQVSRTPELIYLTAER